MGASGGGCDRISLRAAALMKRNITPNGPGIWGNSAYMKVIFNVKFVLPKWGRLRHHFGINKVSHEKEQTWRGPTYP